MVKRYPVVAGFFYESRPDRLRKEIERVFLHDLGPRKLPATSTKRKAESLGFVVPHAGYLYSGPTAAHVYYRLASEGMPEVVVLIGPNHTGLGSAVAIMDEGSWVTPFGEVEIDSELARAIVRNSEFIDINYEAHMNEHSLEVQLPFLQYIFGNEFKIVPITMLHQVPETAKDVANALIKALKEVKRDVVILASSDMTHYEPQDIAKKKDMMAIEKILNLDPDGLYRVVMRENISMCGYGAVMALLYYSRELGAKKAELLSYTTSGDITGDYSAVVGYAAIRIVK